MEGTRCFVSQQEEILLIKGKLCRKEKKGRKSKRRKIAASLESIGTEGEGGDKVKGKRTMEKKDQQRKGEERYQQFGVGGQERSLERGKVKSRQEGGTERFRGREKLSRTGGKEGEENSH